MNSNIEKLKCSACLKKDKCQMVKNSDIECIEFELNKEIPKFKEENE